MFNSFCLIKINLQNTYRFVVVVVVVSISEINPRTTKNNINVKLSFTTLVTPHKPDTTLSVASHVRNIPLIKSTKSRALATSFNNVNNEQEESALQRKRNKGSVECFHHLSPGHRIFTLD